MKNYTKFILYFCCLILVWPTYLYFSQKNEANLQKNAADSTILATFDQKSQSDLQHSSKSLKINIISKKNGVGLSQDVEILQTELTKMGHKIQFVVENEFRPMPKVDINIFSELGDLSFLPYAKKNYFIPNPEWCGYSTEELLKFDKILCKTKESERIFKSIHPHAVYMGFTSIDRLKDSVPKNFKSFMHLSGASIQKGTEPLIKMWVSNPHFPTLLLIRHRGNYTIFPPGSNINLIEQYLSDDTLKDYQNQYGCHVCPSLTEGFGHYINEALSCGNVVITTDAPPMNELVTDKRCLVPYHLSGPWRYSNYYYADPQKLERVVENICSMPEEQLKEIGKKNRNFYLENDRLFKQRIVEIFNPDSVFPSQTNTNTNTSESNQNQKPKTIGIFCYKDERVKSWDPESIKSGIVGSEEAVIYISQKLANLGYQVLILAQPPENSLHSLPDANPRYVSADFNDGTIFDIAIAWRLPWKGKELKARAKKVYLWPHDTYQGNVTDEQISGFDDVLWLSNWQRTCWFSQQPTFANYTKIFGNGINFDQFKPVQERKNSYSCIYGSNYARGLEILLDIWPQVKQQFPKATLDIYYGWQHWGLLSPDKEIKMRLQIDQLSSLDVHEHGLVSHEELNRAYEQASFWTYPCIAPETFCISGLRAQLAGAIPVIIDGSALTETVRYGFKCTTPQEYLATLTKAMQQIDEMPLEERKKMGKFILKEYTWDAIAEKWTALFEQSSILEKPKQEIKIEQSAVSEKQQPDDKTVLIAILAKNKAHVLDKYLKCLSNLEYDKKLITLYIKTDNNSDKTKEILQEWAKNNEPLYHSIIFDSSNTSDTQKTNPHEWNPTRFKVLATIRNNSLLKAKECKTDFYFVVDCDNFIASSTLRDLISKDKPIIAPYLRSIPEPNDLYSNFFYMASESGYFAEHPNHLKILDRSMIGTFKVDVVHCTYLIKSECIDKLNYIDGTNDYEFIIFSRSARKNNVDQYLCNEKEYGVQIHYYENLSLEEEKRRIHAILTMP